MWKFLGALVGAGGVLAQLIAWIRSYRERRARKVTTRGFEAIGRVHALMNLLMADTKANRVLVLKAENGGGVPAPGRQIQSSVLYEIRDRRMKSNIRRWQKRPLDGPYADILSDVLRDGHARVVTDELETGVLRDIYEAEEIAWAEVYLLLTTGSAVFYLSLNHLEADEPTPAERELTRSAVNEIGQLIKEGLAI